MEDSVLLCRDSNWDLDRYRANSIRDSNNDNLNNNVDDPTNLGDGFLCHSFKIGSGSCKFRSKLIPINNALSTTINRLYKFVVPADSTYLVTATPNWFILSLAANLNFNV